MEITPANTQVQREHSASSESKEMEVSKDLGHTKSLEKSSSFQSEESSKVVEESTTQSMESSHTMQASVSQQMSSEQKVTKATFSSSSSFEASEGNGPINSDQKQETETFIDPNKYSAELDPGPTVLLSEPQSSTSEPYSSTLEPYPSTFTSTLESYSSPPQPFSSTYSSTLDPYSSTPKPFSSAIAEHYSSTIQPPSSTLDAPLNLEPYKPSVEPPTSEPYSSATEPYSSTFSEQVSAVPELEKAKSPPKSSEIEEGKIKDTLKEIISEIDNYVQKDDALKEPKQEVKENAASSENISQLPQMDYSSEALKPELQTHQDVLMARLPSCLISSKSDRPMSLPPETLMKLFNSVQIAHELNQVLKADDTEQKDVSGFSAFCVFLTS